MIDVLFPQGSDNVGDELNAWLWPAMIGDLVVERRVTLLGIGTLLNRPFCERLPPDGDIFVLGTGAGYGKPPKMDGRWKIYAVRGPRTAEALSLPPETAVADAAYLLAGLDWQAYGSADGHGDVVVIPHHRSLSLLDWHVVCKKAGVSFLSPLLPAEQFMRRLCSAKLVLAEAMHGAILADIARIPWKAFSFGGQFNTDKWFDWAQALDIDLDLEMFTGFYDPAYGDAALLSGSKHVGRWLKSSLSAKGLGKEKWRRLTPPSWQAERDVERFATSLCEMSKGVGQLSEIAISSHRSAQLLDRVNAMRQDLGGLPCVALSGAPEDFFRSRPR